MSHHFFLDSGFPAAAQLGAAFDEGLDAKLARDASLYADPTPSAVARSTATTSNTFGPGGAGAADYGLLGDAANYGFGLFDAFGALPAAAGDASGSADGAAKPADDDLAWLFGDDFAAFGLPALAPGNLANAPAAPSAAVPAAAMPAVTRHATPDVDEMPTLEPPSPPPAPAMAIPASCPEPPHPAPVLSYLAAPHQQQQFQQQQYQPAPVPQQQPMQQQPMQQQPVPQQQMHAVRPLEASAIPPGAQVFSMVNVPSPNGTSFQTILVPVPQGAPMMMPAPAPVPVPVPVPVQQQPMQMQQQQIQPMPMHAPAPVAVPMPAQSVAAPVQQQQAARSVPMAISVPMYPAPATLPSPVSIAVPAVPVPAVAKSAAASLSAYQQHRLQEATNGSVPSPSLKSLLPSSQATSPTAPSTGSTTTTMAATTVTADGQRKLAIPEDQLKYPSHLIPMDAPIQKKRKHAAMAAGPAGSSSGDEDGVHGDDGGNPTDSKRVKNTLSARRSRARRAAKMDFLETRVVDLEAENDQLKAELALMRQQMAALAAAAPNQQQQQQ
ncbi:hypothetical protein H9P43_000450 [Blastocladiella emersonii ATCC 22665]|nr:hypothetical protein H9P43_000450 [Blastocladiella emersonii ATCC 22665]